MKNEGNTNRRHFFNTHIAGFAYYDGALVFKRLEIGSRLELCVEDDNKFDAYAVALYFEGKKIGYVPRSENKVIRKFLEMGYKDIFDVVLNRVTPHEYPENQLGFSVHIKRQNKQ